MFKNNKKPIIIILGGLIITLIILLFNVSSKNNSNFQEVDYSSHSLDNEKVEEKVLVKEDGNNSKGLKLEETKKIESNISQNSTITEVSKKIEYASVQNVQTLKSNINTLNQKIENWDLQAKDLEDKFVKLIERYNIDSYNKDGEPVINFVLYGANEAQKNAHINTLEVSEETLLILREYMQKVNEIKNSSKLWSEDLDTGKVLTDVVLSRNSQVLQMIEVFNPLKDFTLQKSLNNFSSHYQSSKNSFERISQAIKQSQKCNSIYSRLDSLNNWAASNDLSFPETRYYFETQMNSIKSSLYSNSC